MPHSPRWHANNLWVLDSGRGTIARVDRRHGTAQTFADLSGFTRGLAFSAEPRVHRAVAGAREQRRSAGFPLTDRLPESERFCGVQVLDVHDRRGRGLVKFEAGVDEIFAVQVLPGIAFPAILDARDPLLETAYALSPHALAQVRQ